MARFKNTNWSIKAADGRPNAAQNVDEASLAVLMDIRDELQELNRVFQCPNTLAILGYLRSIRDAALAIQKNTTKKRKPRRRTPATK